jgi:two-component system KDP operon response regulator KdpE
MNRPATILVVDDEPHIRRLLSAALTRAGYDVCEAANFRQALAVLDKAKPDVVLLDLGLPEGDGLELLPLMRRRSDATLLVVSARDAAEEKVTALDLGADDYVTKPFDTEELLARVRTALRHRVTAQGAQAKVMAQDLEIDLDNRRVTKAGSAVHLTPKEFVVLAELTRFPGRVITHDQLMKAVWANSGDRHIEYLRVLIRNLRQKIEADPGSPAIVVNEPGVGYRLLTAGD